MQEQLHQLPPAIGNSVAPTRWTLELMQLHCKLVLAYSLSGIWRLLYQLGIRYKRGRQHVHSPDPDYQTKRDYALWCVEQSLINYPRVLTLYLDEMSYYRQPTIASAWPTKQQRQPLAEIAYHSNNRRRVVAVMDVVMGKVIYEQAYKIGVKQFKAFYATIRQHYPEAEKIYVIQDNWFVHFHPDVLKAAQELDIALVPLPTYAPWLNPIEKLWRKLRQEILHLHRLSDDWIGLQQRVSAFLNSFALGSLDLLHYVGLLPY